MDIEAFLEARREAGQDVIVTEIELAGPPPSHAGDAAARAKPVAHAVSFVDECGRAVTVIIVGAQAGLAIRDGRSHCPRWTEHDVSDPGISL